MALKGWRGTHSNLFYVFTSYGEGSCLQNVCAFTYYCAYHGHFNSQGQDVLYSNMPYTATDLSYCGTPQSPKADFDADSTINVTSHEQMETVTDPDLDAWYDSQGSEWAQGEIADKCYNFGPLNYDNKANQSWNGHFYILQQEWDNVVSGCVQSGP